MQLSGNEVQESRIWRWNFKNVIFFFCCFDSKLSETLNLPGYNAQLML